MRPFLKWAGGKYNLLDKIKSVLPEGNRLVEPFVGAGAVFLNTDYKKYLLGEVNEDLVNVYLQLQNEGQDFIDYCKTFFIAENNAEEKYYQLRALFNETDDHRLKSSLFIYLNRHGFNGLCRYNSSKGFNVPFGQYNKPYFPEDRMQHFLNRAKHTKIHNRDFVDTMKAAKKGDVVYCDPPYVPLSKSASFTSYSAGGFSEKQQLELAVQAEILANKGIPVIISNHDVPFTRDTYKNAKIESFPVQRLISVDSNNRKPVKEVLAVFS